MTHSHSSREWGKIFFCMSISARGTRSLLWEFYLYPNMGNRGSYFTTNNGNSFFRLCASLGSNIFLRSLCYYQSVFSNSLLRRGFCHLAVRGHICRYCNFDSVFCFPFLTPFYPFRPSNSPFNFPPHHRLKQPVGSKLKS